MITPITLGSDRLVRYHVDMAVDTGSDATMMLYDQYVRQLELVDSRQHSVSGLAFGLNGFYPVALGSINSFYIGDAETHNVAVDYLAENETAAAGQTLPGAIGNGILQNFRAVIFDVPQGRMILELKPPPLRREPPALSGTNEQAVSFVVGRFAFFDQRGCQAEDLITDGCAVGGMEDNLKRLALPGCWSAGRAWGDRPPSIGKVPWPPGAGARLIAKPLRRDVCR